MLAAKQPSEAVVSWAEEASLVKNAQDRPWYYESSPSFKQSCRCKKKGVELTKYVCEDNAGYVYLGQCKRCQAIIWSFRSIE